MTTLRFFKKIKIGYYNKEKYKSLDLVKLFKKN